MHWNALQHTATHCSTLQHTTTHCNTLQHTGTDCDTLQQTATHCKMLQHTATHCNYLPWRMGIWYKSNETTYLSCLTFLMYECLICERLISQCLIYECRICECRICECLIWDLYMRHVERDKSSGLILGVRTSLFGVIRLFWHDSYLVYSVIFLFCMSLLQYILSLLTHLLYIWGWFFPKKRCPEICMCLAFEQQCRIQY